MPFSPTDIATLYGWWKADSLALSDGDAIATWTDSGSNGYNGTQSTGTSKPTYKTNIVNSLPVVRFDGNDTLNTSASAGLAAQTLFAVLRPTDQVGADAIVASGIGGLEWRLDSGKSDVLKQQQVDIGAATTVCSASVFQVLALSYTNNGTYAHYYNGSADGSGTHGQTLSVISMGIGGPYETGLLDLAELIMYSAVLSSTDRGSVTTYLGSKYAITVAGGATNFQPPIRRRPLNGLIVR